MLRQIRTNDDNPLIIKTSGGSPTSSSGKGSLTPTDQPSTPTTTERPRKKLSFREPEIMGYYMQMKQNVTSRLSRKGRTPKKKDDDSINHKEINSNQPPTPTSKYPPPLLERQDSADDSELERNICINVTTSSQQIASWNCNHNCLFIATLLYTLQSTGKYRNHWIQLVYADFIPLG
ncbi:hypothetical protein O3M35_002531 [Rhynocoris fuscipes]|uniref:Uncharacterized protein n=1 Tax=Rhynocoris fuscipes TaxID=488301 RepID=A0AAW1CM40_9HEMI